MSCRGANMGSANPGLQQPFSLHILIASLAVAAPTSVWGSQPLLSCETIAWSLCWKNSSGDLLSKRINRSFSLHLVGSQVAGCEGYFSWGLVAFKHTYTQMHSCTHTHIRKFIHLNLWDCVKGRKIATDTKGAVLGGG